MATNKRSVETILVSKNDQGLLSAGTSLVDSSGNFNGSDGQLAVVDFGGYGNNSNYQAITAGDTPNDSPQIAIAQGTPDANNASGELFDGFPARPFEISNPIIGKNSRVWRGKAFTEQRKSAWVIGGDVGNSDEINTADETEFKVNIAFRGFRQDRKVSRHGIDRIDPSFVTPDYTALGTTAPRDHLIQNLVRNVNKHSQAVSLNKSNTQRPIVALAVASTAANVTNKGNNTTMNNLETAGTTVTGYGFSTDAGFSNAITAIINDSSNDIDGSDELVTIDLDNAGSAAGAESIILVGLDEKPAYEDRVPNLGTRIDVGLDSGFDSTVGNYESSVLRSSQGSAREWKIFYEATFGQRKYSQNRSEFPIVELPTYINDSTNYDAYIIEHDVKFEPAVEGFIASPHKTIVLVPTSDSNTKTDLEGVLNPYFADVGLANVNL